MNELAVFVDSYDANEDLWDNFFKVMNHYWPESKINKYLITNERIYNAYNVITINTGTATEWAVCTLKGLKSINEQYVFFMFEDYYFSKRVNDKLFLGIVDIMKERSVFFYRISPTIGMDRSKMYTKVLSENPYAISLQPAIWDRVKLIEILEQASHEGVKTPWQFEYYLTDRALENKNETEGAYVKGVLYDTRDIMGYKNAIIQSKWDCRVTNYYKRKTPINLNLGNRELMTKREMMWDELKQKSYSVFSYESRKIIKKVLKTINFKFMR